MTHDQSTAKDFFLHAGFIVALYASIIAFVNILFRIISISFPRVDVNYYGSQIGSPLSLPVATLIVAFPLFIYFSRVVYNSYITHPDKREFWIRKWLLYITLFIAGVVLAGDLITVIYYFLDGQELSVSFLLKALVLFVVAGIVFSYYLKDLRDGVSQTFRNRSAIASACLVVVVIICGFVTIGSPQKQRLMRYDAQKIQALQTIESDLRSYVQNTGALPKSLDTLYQSVYAYGRPTLTPPDNSGPYTYTVLESGIFELCATFNLPSSDAAVHTFENVWSHDAGNVCFTRTLESTGSKPLPVEYSRPF